MWGVTPEMCAARVNGYVLSSTSVPSTDTVQDMIAEWSAVIMARLESKGVPRTHLLDPDHYAYGICRLVLIKLVVASMAFSRGATTSETTRDVERAGLDMLDALSQRPESLGEGSADPSRVGSFDSFSTALSTGQPTLLDRMRRVGRV